MFKSIKKTFAFVMACSMLFATASASAVDVEQNKEDDLQKQYLGEAYQVTISEDGSAEVQAVTPYNATATLNMELVGTRTYRLTYEIYPGMYNSIGSAGLTVNYGDGTSGYYKAGSGSIGEIVVASSSEVKAYAAGTYTIYVSSCYIDIYDFAGAFAERITDTSRFEARRVTVK